MRKLKIYFIPGLGFDRRIFRNLNLPDLDINYLDWLEPEKNESLNDYAGRLGEPINTEDINILVGHSFGGIISREIACFKNIEKIILLSSIKCASENPLQFKLVAPFKLQYFFTKEFSNLTLKFWGKNYDYAPGEEQELFKSMLNKHSNYYLQWALKQISVWKKKTPPESLDIVHIHGTKDKNFPVNLLKTPFIPIEGGGHFMVYKMPEVISEILTREIELTAEGL